MRFGRIIKMFERGNVFVVGLVGRGKDMLMANVICRRNKPYISNTKYDDVNWHPFNPAELDLAGNSYTNFIEDDVKKYIYPYPDGYDIYISDIGVYFPAQYCNELNRKYGSFAYLFALIRQVAGARIHCNCQALQRCWDKLREQGDQYIMCLWCKVIGGVVVQRIRIYDKYQSCVDRVPPYCVPRPLLNRDRVQRWELDRQHYIISYGNISDHWLIYRNKSNYNTRIFKEMLENGKETNQ